MRQGEILALKWADIDLDRATAIARDTKNGDDRTVPLSSRAIAVLKKIPRSFDGRVIPVAQSSLEHAFKNACDRAEITGLRFHDLRHEATSRLFERGLNPMEVATIIGAIIAPRPIPPDLERAAAWAATLSAKPAEEVIAAARHLTASRAGRILSKPDSPWDSRA